MMLKLGLVINKDSHLQLLFVATNDLLCRRLYSLSITFNIKSTPPDRCPPKLTLPYYNVLEFEEHKTLKLLTLLTNDADHLAK